MLAYHLANRYYTEAVKKFHSSKERNLLRKNDSRSFFDFVNGKLNSRSYIGDVLCSDGSTASTPFSKCEAFNDYFSSVYTSDNGMYPTLDSRISENTPRLLYVIFTPHIVYTKLNQLKPSCSVDSDGLANILLRSCAVSLCTPLCHIFDSSIQ